MSEMDTTVPVLSISNGWDIDEVKSVEDCNDADAVLTESIASIEGQLLHDRLDGFKRGIDWRLKANFALKMKKRALQQIAFKRSAFRKAAQKSEQSTRDQELLDIIKRDFPAQFRAAVQTFILERAQP